MSGRTLPVTRRQRALVIGLAVILAAGAGHAARTRPSHGVYRDRVEPHWFADGTGQTDQFWYAVNLPENRREFVVVNALTGRRGPAFDQQRVAAALSGTLGRPVDAERLPVETIEFSKDGKTVTLAGLEASWKLDLESYALVPESAGDFAGNRLPAARRLHPSLQSGGPTEIKFVNRLQQEVEIFWIDPGGKRVGYGSVGPGQSRENDTYAGHVWLVAARDGTALAVFEAQATAGLAIVDGQGFAEEQPRGGGSRRRPNAASPDGNWEAIVHGGNLFLRDLRTGKEQQLTIDAKPDDTYAGDGEGPRVYWAPDSKHFVAMRLKPGAQRRVYEVESSPEDQLQPKLESYSYLKAGDQVAVSKPHLFDVDAKKETPVSDTLFANPWSIEEVRWNPDSSRFTFLYNQRGHQALRIVAVDAQTGAARAIVDEESKTFIDYSGKYFSQYLDDTGEIIWMSERDGWNQLYLYDGKTGAVKNQITKGEWVVRSVDFVDAAKRQIWFEAGGMVPGQDPYYIQYCRVNFDGSGLTILTEGNGTHTVQFSPDRSFLIDTWSRVDLPPVTELRRGADGTEVCKLEDADAGELYATGWKPPESFVAKGRDGVTDIYGVIWRPGDFDPGKEYPIIESNYAGPQDSSVPTAFSTSYEEQRLANDGFIVVKMDGMGTSNRSKKFHDVCWKNLKDAGFPDRILWIKAAAAKYPCMDLARVGIYGTSAGGQDALRGILDHGDFYKVCVADSGCYDNRMDKIWWNEQWMGWPVDESYIRSSCVVDAHKLQGKLLLMVGELDQNVDPSSTMQVVNALIRADKDFDLLDMPGAGHGVAGTPYGWRRLQKFFVENLLGPGASPE